MADPLVLAPAAAAIPTFAVAASIFILGIVMIARESATRVGISFFVLALVVATWLGGISMMLMAVDERTAMLFARVAWSGVAIIPAAILQFSLALLERTRRHRIALRLVWTGSAVALVLCTATDLVVTGAWRYSWGFYPRLGAGSIGFLLFLGATLTTSLMMLGRAKTHTERERHRNESFLGALAVASFGVIDFIPSYGIALYPVGCLAILAFTVLAVRAIGRFRLSDLGPSFVADQILQTMHGGVLVVDPYGCIRLANAVAADLLGYTPEELRGADLRALLGVSILPVTDSDSFCRHSMTRQRPATWRKKDGESIELLVSATAIRDESDDPIGILYAISDLSDRRRAERAEFGAYHDTLTRVPNRAGLANAFAEMRERVSSSNRVAGVFFIDLNGFKAVNDRYGHAVGDTLLQLVAGRIRNAIRGDDVVARHGGDEFVVLLNLARVEDGPFVAAKLRRVVGEPYAINDERVRVSASIGAAYFPRDAADADTLIRLADVAMYAVKNEEKLKIRATSGKDDSASPPPFGIDARA